MNSSSRDSKGSRGSRGSKESKGSKGSSSSSDKKCNNVITFRENGGTCWFTSILMAVLYSDESRKLMLEKSKTWDTTKDVYKTFEYILKNKYERSKSIGKDYPPLDIDTLTPDKILHELYEHSKKKFIYDPIKYKDKGFTQTLYIRKIYKLLGAKVLYLSKVGDDMYYSLYNNIEGVDYDESGVLYTKFKDVSYETILEKLKDKPDVIIVDISENNSTEELYEPYYKLSTNNLLSDLVVLTDDDLAKLEDEDLAKFAYLIDIEGIKSLRDVVEYDKNEYVQDSVLLNNWNNTKSSHAIAGIKCKGSKYVYNGWLRTKTDDKAIKKLYDEPKYTFDIGQSIPCELMRTEWDINKDQEFCLNTQKCKLEAVNPDKFCFSFNKGPRIAIYVKKNKPSENIKDSKSSAPKSSSSKSSSSKSSSPPKSSSSKSSSSKSSSSKSSSPPPRTSALGSRPLKNPKKLNLNVDPERYTRPLGNDGVGKNCNNVLTLLQNGGICWFNSLLMSVLYSDESRKLLLEKSKMWNMDITVLNTIKFILEKNYLKTQKDFKKNYDNLFELAPEKILGELFNYNSKKFKYDPIEHKDFGLDARMYIRKLYKLLGVKVLYLDKIGDKMYYSIYNNIHSLRFDIGETDNIFMSVKSIPLSQTKLRILNKFINPDVIIVNIISQFDKVRQYQPHYDISKTSIDIESLKSLTDIIQFGNNDYRQDSVLLDNWNGNTLGYHTITGIRCNNDKYVYNGWSKKTKSKIEPYFINSTVKRFPCQLMKYDWDINNDEDFCLNRKTCKLNYKNEKKLCFSFGKSTRIVIYVKINRTTVNTEGPTVPVEPTVPTVTTVPDVPTKTRNIKNRLRGMVNNLANKVLAIPKNIFLKRQRRKIFPNAIGGTNNKPVKTVKTVKTVKPVKTVKRAMSPNKYTK
jgi:hypothetical protein